MSTKDSGDDPHGIIRFKDDEIPDNNLKFGYGWMTGIIIITAVLLFIYITKFKAPTLLTQTTQEVVVTNEVRIPLSSAGWLRKKKDANMKFTLDYPEGSPRFRFIVRLNNLQSLTYELPKDSKVVAPVLTTNIAFSIPDDELTPNPVIIYREWLDK